MLAAKIGFILYLLVVKQPTCESRGNGWGNVSFNKTAYQSSIGRWTKNCISILGYPWRAVDGNRATLMEDGSCVFTERDWDPWWLVDLGDVYAIKHVTITSRDFDAQKLQNFTIETSHFTDGDPSLGALVNPVLCLYHPGVQYRNTTKTYPCHQTAMGRFVKIMRLNNGKTQPLYFCEVEVYGTNTERLYELSVRPDERSLNQNLGHFTVQTPLQCYSLCLKTESCTSFNIEMSSGWSQTCELINLSSHR